MSGLKLSAAVVLFDWLVRQRDGDGLVMIRTTAMAHATGLGQSTVEVLLTRWANAGAVPVVRRGGNTGPSVRRPMIEMRDVAVGMPAVHPGRQMNSAPALRGAPLVPNGPPVPKLAAVRTRCPWCELPPGHAECRHGWDGTSRAIERRSMMAAVGLVPRAAA